jgi:hemoglobin
MHPQPPRRRPVSSAIDESLIHDLVHGFYARVRADAQLGPIFDRVIGAGWDEHLAKMCSFWSSVMLLTGSYKGNPMIAHMRLKMVRPEHFERWLSLFRETAGELCDPQVAALFVGKAENIARSLQLGMFYRPGARDAAPAARGPLSEEGTSR